MRYRALALFCIVAACLAPAAWAQTTLGTGGIQALIYACPPGGMVTVPAGTYTGSLLIPANKTGIKLVANGTVKLVSDGSANHGILVEGNGARIQGLEISGFHGPSTAGEDTGLAAISVTGPTSVTITKCTLHGNDMGIRIAGPQNPAVPQSYEVTDNEVSGNLWHGINVRTVDGAEVEDNDVHDNGQGILVFQSGGVVVEDNTVADNGDLGNRGNPENSGISVVACGGLYKQAEAPVVVSGNGITGNAGAGVLVHGSVATQVTGNCSAANGTGVWLEYSSGVYATHNVVSGSVYDGIVLVSFTTDCHVNYNLVTGNGTADAAQGQTWGGIHVSCMFYDPLNPPGTYAVPDVAGNHIHWNVATNNAAYDASDETVLYDGKLHNRWSRNTLGTVGLGSLR